MYLQQLRRVLTVACGFLLFTGPLQARQQNTDTTSTWSSDVIGVIEEHLSANYWVENDSDPSQVLKNTAAIAELNAYSFSHDPSMVRLDEFPETMSAAEITKSIQAISKAYKAPLFDKNNIQLSHQVYKNLSAALNLEQLEDDQHIPIRFALVVNRANMRTYPDAVNYYSTPGTKFLDRFQENGLFPGDEIAVLHQSKDAKWYFVQSYNYAAWVQAEKIAFAPRDRIREYKTSTPFLVITGDKVTTTYNPGNADTSELQLDMGVRLPLADPGNVGHNVNDQNPYTSYSVLLPTRDADGSLKLEIGLIPRNKDVHVGYLELSHENITRQAFKFLGERYGWGHSYNARDCTGFVAEVYKSFGIALPRNSGQQGNGPIGENIRFDQTTATSEKLKALKDLNPGDLIYTPGHVLMYIGSVEEQPYVIHDVSSMGYLDENGEFYEGVLNSVAVTPFLPLRYSANRRYIDKIYNIKKLK